MCGRYALYGPISRHRKNKPVDDLPDWYPTVVDAINACPMCFNVAPTDVMPIVGVNREGGISIREIRWGLVGVRRSLTTRALVRVSADGSEALVLGVAGGCGPGFLVADAWQHTSIDVDRCCRATGGVRSWRESEAACRRQLSN